MLYARLVQQKCNANGTYDVRLDDGEKYKGFTVLIAIVLMTSRTHHLWQV